MAKNKKSRNAFTLLMTIIAAYSIYISARDILALPIPTLVIISIIAFWLYSNKYTKEICE